ncbi:MAG: bifunctional hydroxymethylpyrimidine kinase/phosphomethylpyrimidine kinase [Dehalococcoidia bacterium]|nr:bifunctional hydroxymethylpyrimidine kinase/phosphomethylpyrimidine kinase [Dehalococcoidia bacterium]
MARALTIAGSDSGGGAGVQADLKTFMAFGVHGMSAVTAVTAQNTLGVQAAQELPVGLIEQQIRSVTSDIGVDAVKTGMLSSTAIVAAVGALVRELRLTRLVVDPVMMAKGGHPLLAEDARQAVLDQLLPQAMVATPNLPEAEALTGMQVRSVQEMRAAAVLLHERGARWVVVKGGHLRAEEDAVDVVYDGREFTELRAPRTPTRNTHGTGCTFSAAICAGLAKGYPPLNAIRLAKEYVTQAIATGPRLGQGHGPVNHLAGVRSIW